MGIEGPVLQNRVPSSQFLNALERKHNAYNKFKFLWIIKMTAKQFDMYTIMKAFNNYHYRSADANSHKHLH